MNKIIVLLIFLSVLIPGCAKRTQSSSVKAPTEDKTELSGLALVSMNISKKKFNRYDISISNATIVNTSKKARNPSPVSWNADDFICFILDENEHILDTLLIFQPLNQRYEYPQDDGSIGSEIIEETQRDVLISFNYDPEMKYLQVDRVKKNNKLKTEAILPVPVQFWKDENSK